jgi:UPF0271 protein
MPINFNADIGEGFANEHLLLPSIDACNIACNAHAGSLAEMEKCVKLAIEHNVTIGAHPSFEDRENFGRLSLQIGLEEIFESVKKQMQLLQEIVNDYGAVISHIKPHGALYHQACTDKKTAQVIIEASKSIVATTSIVGLPNSILEQAAVNSNCHFIKEGFADRRYHSDMSLVSRKNEKALITKKEEVLLQVQSMIQGKTKTIEGTETNSNIQTDINSTMIMGIDTICFHGDTPGAVELLNYCRKNVL